jgi:hypothetical protein
MHDFTHIITVSVLSWVDGMGPKATYTAATVGEVMGQLAEAVYPDLLVNRSTRFVLI